MNTNDKHTINTSNNTTDISSAIDIDDKIEEITKNIIELIIEKEQLEAQKKNIPYVNPKNKSHEQIYFELKRETENLRHKIYTDEHQYKSIIRDLEEEIELYLPKNRTRTTSSKYGLFNYPNMNYDDINNINNNRFQNKTPLCANINTIRNNAIFEKYCRNAGTARHNFNGKSLNHFE